MVILLTLIRVGNEQETDDDQYCVIPRADIGAREATTDKAVGIPVSAVELEPQNAAVAPEYWFDSSEVTAGG